MPWQTQQTSVAYIYIYIYMEKLWVLVNLNKIIKLSGKVDKPKLTDEVLSLIKNGI